VAPTPGPRATAFLNLYQKTLDITLRNVSYENFAACFPTIAANAPENLRGMHAAMIERLEKFAQVCSTSFTLSLHSRVMWTENAHLCSERNLIAS
jgi:fructose-1,6-bisphosphatase